MIYEFNGYRPVIHQSSFVHPQANVTGNVIIGASCYIGPGAVLRGDWGEILVADGCNIQENCVVHMFPGKSAVFEEGAHIGHGAIIHGATVGKNVLVGMNAVLMDDVVVGENSLIGALCFVPANMVIPTKSLVVGNPAKIIKEVSDEMIDWKTQGTKLYQQLPADCYNSLRECEPLREKEANRPAPQQYFFKTWADKKTD
jgi:carbonic anhydrase/acetyltransferase-like protein (isoleucine patch superfamily)